MLSTRFKTKNMGPARWVLGMRLTQTASTIVLDQDQYLRDVLHRFRNSRNDHGHLHQSTNRQNELTSKQADGDLHDAAVSAQKRSPGYSSGISLWIVAMASMSVWLARLRIAQDKRLGLLPERRGNRVRPTRGRKPRTCRDGPIAERPVPSRQVDDGVLSTTRPTSVPRLVQPSDRTKAADVGQVDEPLKFGEGVLTEEELKRQRVRKKGDAGRNEWTILMNSKAEQYKRSVAEEMASKRSKQNKFGEEIRVQIDEIRKRNQREAEERQTEARRILEQIKMHELEEARKEQRLRERNEHDRVFVQDQLRLRAQAAQAAEAKRRELEARARATLQRQAERDRRAREEERRRFQEEMRVQRMENEQQLTEKKRRHDEERQRDIEEQRRLLLTSQAVEEAKRGQMQKLANKVAMLEKDNEAVQRAVQERLKEEERRIARFQEEASLREAEAEQNKLRRQRERTIEMKAAIQKQLDEKRAAYSRQVEESKRLANTIRQLSAEEEERRKHEVRSHQVYSRRVIRNHTRS
ncbi:hypothetical protein PBRA_000924 [Plasmodiophora brassicae]|uniref:Trichohyalin-plectin-homology domain-containing protein n=1 Tax=Plasmodiophora brassicae TaxID=37360 RepID=A0A0G4IQX7_PLABS|nr:hypothetical protein PBRA_000924 [Plasmodiophora brassicae]